MISRFPFHRPLAALIALLSFMMARPADSQAVTIESQHVETAVLDPANWDDVFAGETYFDAVRPMLVRFPGVAEQVHERLQEGLTIERAELVLTWDRQEGARPQRGRHGWGAEGAYERTPGRWHAIAYPLNEPWDAGLEGHGPTADAYLHSLAHWARGCARGDSDDRIGTALGPVALHEDSPTGRIDLTGLLADDAYGETLGHRLRALEERGLSVLKNELYDLTYNNQDGWWFDVYSWRAGTGYMRIWVAPPRLVFHLTEAATPAHVDLPPPLDYRELLSERRDQPVGRSHMAPPGNWEELVRHYTSPPADMPDWQWQRIGELRELNGWNLGRFDVTPLLSLDRQAYRNAFPLTMAPRHWHGHLTSDYALLPAAFGNLLPGMFADHLKLYWTAWLHPDTEYPESPRKRSYFRHYSWSLGTQNFNYNAIAGCYLGGQFIDSEYALADARYGLENIMLRLYAFYGGANQEIGDTYYQALSNAAPQMIGKFADDPLDALMGQIASDRLTEQLVSMYNPGIRRMTHPMGRGELKYQTAFQDGPYFIMHSLSPNGALIDMDAGYRAQRYNVPLFGHEGPPGRMAALAPWGEPEWANVVDTKPYPWQVTARWFAMRPDEKPSEWHINYMTENYTMSSRSEDGQPVTHVTAQWRRNPGVPTRMEDISTLQLSFGTNGRVYQSMGAWGMVHHRNKLFALKALPPRRSMQAPPNPDYGGGWRATEQARGGDSFNAIHSSIMIIAFGDVSGREVWINDRMIDQLSGESSPSKGVNHPWEQHLRTTGENSVFARTGDRIAIKDGATYIGLIPLAANPMARDAEVELAYEWPVLYVHSFLYRSGDPLSLEAWYDADRKATSGFVVEMGDRNSHGSFTQFREAIAAATLEQTWNDERHLTDLTYHSGGDTLEMGFHPWTMVDHVGRGNSPDYRRVNGQWPYLPEGIHRDSPWSVQGETGHLEKNGAQLRSERGYRTFLLAEPASGMVTAYNPAPDPIFMTLHTANGHTLRANGRLGLARIHVLPERNLVRIEHHLTEAQRQRQDMATAILLSGFTARPEVLLNGMKPELHPIEVDGVAGYALRLEPDTDVDALPATFNTAAALWQAVDNSHAHQTYFRDWYVVGPFSSGSYAQENFVLESFGPEKGFDPDATYTGIAENSDGERVDAEVHWQPVLNSGESALSAEPVWLEDHVAPHNAVIAYAAASIVSDRERTVQLLAASDERLGIWVNGQRVVFNTGYRMCWRDQDRAFIQLREGENPVLIKMSRGYESWRLYFRLADANGLPLDDGVAYRGAHGLVAAGAAPTAQPRH